MPATSETLPSRPAPGRPAGHPADRPAGRRAELRRELRATLLLAGPMALTQVGQMALFTTDTMLIGRLGTEALASAALGTALMTALFLFGMGVLLATAAFTAQHHGAGDAAAVSRSAGQGLLMSVVIGLLVVAVLGWSEELMLLFGQQPVLAARAGGYLEVLRWSVPPGLGFLVLRSFVASLDRPQPALWVMMAGIPLNAGLGILLIFGHWGLPRMELAGAGTATIATQCFMMLTLLAIVERDRRFAAYRVLAHALRPHRAEIGRILKVGLPIGATLIMEIGLFTVAMLMMGWIGADEVAAHQIALQIIATLFMIPLGLAQASTVRVGAAFGRGDPDGVRRAGWLAFVLGTGFMMLSMTLIWSLPETLVRLFVEGAESERAVGLAVGFLVVAGFFQIVDGLQVIGASVLRGLNDTRMPMLMAAFGYWCVGAPACYLLGFTAGLDGRGIWMGLACGLATTAVLLVLRFRRMSLRV